ncbi:DUF1707 SHOCT-like domain-containing protein [Glycomyces algeriensis]|uniref:DUF1707 domain-containing protein n=1 Tax=Glycomyces algeriensis TaxID=256037 RepID=A0A9W6G866_9ACTN|nr:DUF1707 domain-containing protein [Glycomyces algeriensis]MDA1368769.1 DUF1707 domain-containing protein [Glycomyces algeriensis]MDR7349389.1 hypothetical protein [Glycomyces algeriensis]GLI42092.1 hypothetical protein GALLR39Z86_19420 [Glycomyces algeriensis]
MTEDHGKLRISNADRDLAIAQLQAALDEGRIDLVEFDERAKTAYEAKTNAELDLIFEDLPGGRPKAGEVVPAGPAAETARAERAPRGRSWFHDVPALRALILVGGICTLIWLAGSVSSGEYGNFWPVWPIMGLSIATFVQLVNRGRWGDDDEDDGPRRERRGHDWH